MLGSPRRSGGGSRLAVRHCRRVLKQRHRPAVNVHRQLMLARVAAMCRICTAAAAVGHRVAAAAAVHARGVVGVEQDGVAQHKIQGLGEAVLGQRHVRLLLEQLRRLQRSLQQPLLACGGEGAVGNVVPREFDGGSRRLRSGMRVWYAVVCHGGIFLS